MNYSILSEQNTWKSCANKDFSLEFREYKQFKEYKIATAYAIFPVTPTLSY